MTPRTVFIFHGTAGHPGENWFPWLRQQLEGEGHRVIVPQFPTPEGQSLTAWRSVLREHEHLIDDTTIIVGHSLGGIFLLRVLETLSSPIAGAVFVGTPIGIQPMKFYASDSAFSGFTFDWDAIRRNAQVHVIFQSDDDPYVPLENGEQLAQHLGVPLMFIPNAGHFNTAAGYTTFPALLTALRPLFTVS